MPQLLGQPPTAPAASVQLIEDLESLWPRRAEWDALAARGDTNTAFQTLAWQLSWWRTLRGDARPLVLLAEEGGRLAAAAPLMLVRRQALGGRERAVEFIGTGTADYCDFIFDRERPAPLRGLLAWLDEHRQGWDRLSLVNIPGGSASLLELSDLFRRRRYPVDARLLYEAPARILGDAEADREAANRESMRKAQRYFQRQGAVELRNLTAPDEIAAYLEPFFEQHVRRWADTPTPSLFLREEPRAFYRELARTLAPDGRLLFSVLLLDGAPLAFQLGFLSDGRMVGHKLSFDIAHARRSPGRAFFKYMLDYAIDSGLAEFDFGIGEEPYKYQFSNHARQIYGLTVFRASVPYQLNRLWLDAKGWVKRSPALSRAGRSLLQRLRRQPS